MRNEFIQNLITYRKSNIPISLIVGDLGYSVVEPFANMFPESFFNSGVAEQNMAGLAAGMASEGETVFTYSICNLLGPESAMDPWDTHIMQFKILG